MKNLETVNFYLKETATDYNIIIAQEGVRTFLNIKKEQNKDRIISSTLRILRREFGSLFLIETDKYDWFKIKKNTLAITGFLVYYPNYMHDGKNLIIASKIHRRAILHLPIIKSPDFEFLIKKHNKNTNKIHNSGYVLCQNLNKAKAIDRFKKENT